MLRVYTMDTFSILRCNNVTV